MAVLDWLLGRTLASHEESEQHIGPLHGVPVLGLDALSSAAYGPEAALTLLIPLGAAGLSWVGPISLLIVLILGIVFFSYRQTIAAYPGGGGSYTVAKENLGTRPALFAGAALALDYILNVAVGISAGVGALVSALPSLLPHTVLLCLVILGLLTIVNLRGTKESGVVFLLPTYAFIGTLGVVLAIGIGKTLAAHGHPVPVTPPPAIPALAQSVGVWLLMRAFAGGCTAMTGVEAVSNGVPLFRNPRVHEAQRTLTIIIAVLVALLLGVAFLARAYGIAATEPGQAGYQSVLSMLVAAIIGRGVFYYVTLGSVVAVLALSANTSFADFPRLCRVLANDRFLPSSFAVRGRRLVFSQGIFVLSIMAGILLVVFGGITDRLIPLFAIGAFLAFTLSQAGMVQHWRRLRGGGSRISLVVNATGAVATGLTLVVVAVSKVGEGAWVTIVLIPLMVWFFLRVSSHYAHIARQIATTEPLELPELSAPIAVVPAGAWSRLTQQALRFALRLTHDVYVVQVRTEQDEADDLAHAWDLQVGTPARQAGIKPPQRVVLVSETRRFFAPFVQFVQQLERDHPETDIVVVIPDLVLAHWYEHLLHNHRGAFLRTLLRMRCGSRTVIVNTPFHLKG